MKWMTPCSRRLREAMKELNICLKRQVRRMGATISSFQKVNRPH